MYYIHWRLFVLDVDAYDEDEDGYDDDADDAKNMRIYGVACGQE